MTRPFRGYSLWIAFALALGYRPAAMAGEATVADPGMLTAPPVGVGVFPVGTIAESGGTVTLRRPWMGPQTPDRPAEGGDVLYPGDELATAAGAYAEILWGVNVRVRVGPGSRVAIRSGAPLPPATRLTAAPADPFAPPPDGAGAVEWRVASGAARVRVRENALLPATILLTTRRTLVVLRRGDATLQSADGTDQVGVNEGTATVWSKAWQGILSRGEGLSARGQPVAWTLAGNDPLREALRFSVDQARALLPQPP